MKIAVIGSNMVDLTTYITRMPVLGETIEAPDFSIGCGGKGANQAVAAAKCGVEVLMLSKVGDDLFSDNTIENFKKNGIDTKYVHKVEGVSSGVAPIFVEESGQNSILIIKGANNHLLPKDIDDAKEGLCQCGLIILQLEIPLETVYYAIEFGNEHNIPVILNPAPATSGLDFEKICHCNFIMPNETELSILTGMPVSTMDEIKVAAQILVNHKVENVIVTLGDKGALLVTKDKMEWFPSYKVNATDTSGAGDAFIGCFSSHYAVHHNVQEAIRQANAYAALSVTKRGTQKSYSTKEELAAFLANV